MVYVGLTQLKQRHHITEHNIHMKQLRIMSIELWDLLVAVWDLRVIT